MQVAQGTMETSRQRQAAIKAKAYVLMAAFLSFILSVYLFFTGDKLNGIFVGIWVPSILSAGQFLIGNKHHE